MAKIFFFFFPTDTLLFVSLDFIYEFLCFAFKLKTCNKSSPLFFFFFSYRMLGGIKEEPEKLGNCMGSLTSLMADLGRHSVISISAPNLQTAATPLYSSFLLGMLMV